MNRMILGLDLGTRSLSAVVVEKPFKGFSIRQSVTVSFDDLEHHGSSDAEQPNVSRFERAVSVLLDELDCKEFSSVAVAIPSSSVSFRNITLPFRSPKKIRQVLGFELASHLPLADKAYVSDFTLPKRTGAGDFPPLLTASVPDESLGACFMTLATAGLKPSLITVQGYIAVDHLLGSDNGEDHTLWIDRAEDHTTLCLVIKGTIVQVRSLGANLSATALARAIHQTVQGENQRSQDGFLPQRCTITSREADAEALCHPLEAALGYPVRCAETGDPDMDAHPINAMSAALAEVTSRPVFNFCQGDYSEDSILKRYTANIVVLLIFVVMAFSAFLFKLHADISYMENNASALEQASIAVFKKSFPNVKRIVDPLMQMQIELKQLKETSGLSAEGSTPQGELRHGCVDILAELSKKIPASMDVETTRFILNPGRILLSGSTANFNDVDRIKGLLEGSDLFKQVEIQSAAADKTGKRVRFKFVITL
ncbi:MAG: PilN domain-containing protein [Desulfobacterium sp.]|nr:PilN domain-containing protein [Desulfobacterium sp.]